MTTIEYWLLLGVSTHAKRLPRNAAYPMCLLLQVRFCHASLSAPCTTTCSPAGAEGHRMEQHQAQSGVTAFVRLRKMAASNCLASVAGK